MIDRATPPTDDGPPAVTDEMIRLFLLACEIQDDGNTRAAWETDSPSGRRREYLNTAHDLHVLLGRKLWEAQVTDTIGMDEPPSWMRADHHADWREARLIRIALEAAADLV